MVDEISLKRLNITSLEILATLADNLEGIIEERELPLGSGLAIKYVHKEGFVKPTTIQPKTIIMKSIGQNDPRTGYKITDKGNELIKKILEYVNDSLLVEGFRYL